MILVANIDENQLMEKDYPSKKDLAEFAESANTPLIELCIKTELEISELEPEDREMFLEELGSRNRE